MQTAVSHPGKVRRYLSLIKFSHTIFALPFAFIGFTIGTLELVRQGTGQVFQWPLLVKMLLCMVFARSAAMAFNRYLDRRFDALNPRTAMREIPAGAISPRSALVFTIINCLLFIATTYTINTACFSLSFVALFVVLFYSYTKRFTALCHLVLGVGLSLSPIGAYLAVTGHFALFPLLFSFAVLTWVAGFDIIYALQDEEFDRSQKLHSIPAALGVRNALYVSSLLHVLSAAFVIWAGIEGSMHLIYWTGAAFYAALLVYQHMLVKPNDLSKVGMAFANTNGIASVVFAVFTIAALLLA
ncbi:UbiA-like polyprenyltransferase [Nemorincola caseinilytica]|uniref:UbiA-like polyprenyltransferase n=1 Tax=Nemorincola caseinilytica TaxID=2054315 RepID=A0ABP8N8L3_9BACT